ncbi:MAG: hypothetical protein AB1798_16155 [Spirochaetota bacterium]
MLVEFKDVRQIKGEGYRRWFKDDFFDLIVWYTEDGKIYGFQLCYDKFGNERAVTWDEDHGYRHHKIDDGEIPGQSKMTPILIQDGIFSKNEIAERFKGAGGQVDQDLVDFVYRQLKDYS